MTDDLFTDELIRRVGEETIAEADPALFSDSQFVAWLSADLRVSANSAERAQFEEEVTQFATRLARKISARRISLRIRRQRFAHANELDAKAVRLFDLQVAAGNGRELWDEDCETWIKLPDGLPDARYVALRVAGDSMLPLLEERDVILIQLGTIPAVDDLIVARTVDDEYVVKRVNRIERRDIELEPLNPKYGSFTIPNDGRHVLGTVLARFYGS
jgi:phage repressor protein C with HTH and peptisase S24 domain